MRNAEYAIIEGALCKDFAIIVEETELERPRNYSLWSTISIDLHVIWRCVVPWLNYYKSAYKSNGALEVLTRFNSLRPIRILCRRYIKRVRSSWQYIVISLTTLCGVQEPPS